MLVRLGHQNLSPEQLYTTSGMHLTIVLDDDRVVSVDVSKDQLLHIAVQ
jgi:hypothetical protein